MSNYPLYDVPYLARGANGSYMSLERHRIVRREKEPDVLGMAKVEFDPGIDSVRGILMGTDPFYIRRKVERSTSPSADEIAARVRFAAVAAAVKTRSKDLMNMSSDQTAFLAQKDTAGGKKTLRAYLWKVCGDAYDQQHGQNNG